MDNYIIYLILRLKIQTTILCSGNLLQAPLGLRFLQRVNSIHNAFDYRENCWESAKKILINIYKSAYTTVVLLIN